MEWRTVEDSEGEFQDHGKTMVESSLVDHVLSSSAVVHHICNVDCLLASGDSVAALALKPVELLVVVVVVAVILGPSSIRYRRRRMALASTCQGCQPPPSGRSPIASP